MLYPFTAANRQPHKLLWRLETSLKTKGDIILKENKVTGIAQRPVHSARYKVADQVPIVELGS